MRVLHRNDRYLTWTFPHDRDRARPPLYLQHWQQHQHGDRRAGQARPPLRISEVGREGGRGGMMGGSTIPSSSSSHSHP